MGGQYVHNDRGLEMFQDNELEKGRNVTALAQAQRTTVDQRAGTVVATPVSCIGAGMSIVGNVECSGPAQVFGRIQGQLRATDLVIGEGAQVDGSIQAQEVTVRGRAKGTIRAVGVKLQGADVEGDIIHRTLSIDESSVFQGTSRRVENSAEDGADPKAELSSTSPSTAAKKAMQSPPLVSSADPGTNGELQPH
jgi:cytoskeletal protein CcmA (bactofilin family)